MDEWVFCKNGLCEQVLGKLSRMVCEEERKKISTEDGSELGFVATGQVGPRGLRYDHAVDRIFQRT